MTVFEKRTGDPSLDDLGKIAADWITEALVPLGADVLPSSQAIAASSVPTPAGEGDAALSLARRTGSGLLVTGSYNLSGEKIQIRASLVEAATGRILAAPAPSNGPTADPMQALIGLQAPIRDALAVHLDRVVARNAGLLDLPRPPAYAAYREFVLSLVAQDDVPVSRRHLEKALEIDPEFDAARVFLADRLAYERRYAECFAHLDVVAGHVDRLTPFQRLHFEVARTFHSGRYGAALTFSRQLMELAPDSTFYISFHVSSALAANRPEEALAAVEKLVGPDPSPPGVVPTHFTRAADAHHIAGRYES